MSGLAICTALAVFLLSAPALHAREAQTNNSYTPPGLYDVEQVKLANGFRAVLKQRKGTRNVSFRLVVKIGSRYFDCSRRETPHLIEHLLFSGTSAHTEPQLDRLIEEHGGTWNASTGGSSTTYEIDIFDRYADLAVDTLYEIVTKTLFTEDKLRTVKGIVARENGGTPTVVRRILYRYGIGKTAWKKADEWLLPGTGAMCPGLPDLGATKMDEIVSSFKTSYVPGNMVLVAVGNFDHGALIEQLRRTFGALAPAPVPVFAVHTPPYPQGGPIEVSGSFAPFLGSNGYVGAAYRTEGLDSPDLPVLRVLSSYLDKKLYEELRVRNGLSYGPEVSGFLRPDYGILYVSADAAISQTNRVSDLIHHTLDRIRKTPPDHDQIEGIKQKLLLRWVQGCETNTAAANFYADHLAELEQGGFRNYALGIERVTAADVARLADTYLRSGTRADVRGLPTLTYTQFFLSIALLLLAIIWVMTVILKRRARARRRMPPSYIRKL